jgi:hypothetical protein
MSMHSGRIVAVENDHYVIREGISDLKAWILGVEFIDPPEN